MAAQWLWAHPDMQARVNSVVTFDSPLRGVPDKNISPIPGTKSACNTSSSLSWNDLWCQVYSGEGYPENCASVIVRTSGIAEIGKKVDFFTMDAAQNELLGVIEFVPRDRTTLLSSESRIHCQFDDNHSSVWGRESTDGDPVKCWSDFRYSDDYLANPNVRDPDFSIDKPSKNVKAVFVGCALTQTPSESCEARLKAGR